MTQEMEKRCRANSPAASKRRVARSYRCLHWSQWYNDNSPNVTRKDHEHKTRAELETFCPSSKGGNITRFQCVDEKREPFKGNRTWTEYDATCEDMNIGLLCVPNTGHSCADFSIQYCCQYPPNRSSSTASKVTITHSPSTSTYESTSLLFKSTIAEKSKVTTKTSPVASTVTTAKSPLTYLVMSTNTVAKLPSTSKLTTEISSLTSTNTISSTLTPTVTTTSFPIAAHMTTTTLTSRSTKATSTSPLSSTVTTTGSSIAAHVAITTLTSKSLKATSKSPLTSTVTTTSSPIAAHMATTNLTSRYTKATSKSPLTSTVTTTSSPIAAHMTTTNLTHTKSPVTSTVSTKNSFLKNTVTSIGAQLLSSISPNLALSEAAKSSNGANVKKSKIPHSKRPRDEDNVTLFGKTVSVCNIIIAACALLTICHCAITMCMYRFLYKRLTMNRNRVVPSFPRKAPTTSPRSCTVEDW